MTNYYDVLEIQENASLEVIKAAYKALAKKYHPDNWEGRKAFANQRFVEIKEAYEVLSDEILKRQYDEQLKKVRAASIEHNTINHNTRGKDESINKDGDNKTKKADLIVCALKTIGKSILCSWEKAQQEVDKAYSNGLKMSDFLLVRDYRKATGFKRAGYAKAMEERGFLERNTEGKLVATDKMKTYW